MRLIAYCGMAAILFKSVVMQGLVPPRREITVAGATNELITLHICTCVPCGSVATDHLSSLFYVFM